MEQLDFKPAKSKTDFRSNYRLHDLAETVGKNLLVQWNIKFRNFGEDRRFTLICEKGEEKPDTIIHYDGKSVLIEWKGKHSSNWIVSEKSVKSYDKWKEKLKLPVLICFFEFNEANSVVNRRFAIWDMHTYSEIQRKQWDKNKMVEFGGELPVFNKLNLIEKVFNYPAVWSA